jgi:uncharacterized repeat protein (TIGR02059 family)
MKRFLSLLAICTLWLTAYPQGYEGYTRCALQDSLALVAFYHAADGPNWLCNQDGFSISNLSDNVLSYYTTDYPHAGMGKWLQGPVKDWFGVLLEEQTVPNSDQKVWRVVHLRPTISRRSAGDNKLKGYVPREVGMLTALKWFKVNGNLGLGGTELPDEIYHPTMLQFDVENVYFKGVVSSAIRQCTKLQYTNLRYNHFDSIPTFDFLPASVLQTYYSPGAQAFYFYNNQISYANLEASIDYFKAVGDVQYEARQMNNVGRAREVVVVPGQSVVTLTSEDAGANGIYTWYRRGMNTYKTGNSYTINNVAAKDTGNYTALIGNEYIRLNDANSDYVNCFTKPIHVTFVPSSPYFKSAKTTYSGKQIEVTFNFPLAVPNQANTSFFSVTRNNEQVTVKTIAKTGRLGDRLLLDLETAINEMDVVTISYVQGTVTGYTGGLAMAFTDKVVKNLTRPAPSLISAQTRTDGLGIVLTFDRYVDPSTINTSDFTVRSSASSLAITSVGLKAGELDNGISAQVELGLLDPLTDTDVVTVSYNKGSLTALYGSELQVIEDFPVVNAVVANRITVTLMAIDGSGTLTGLVVKGNMQLLPYPLFNDGTNGDETANDHVWTRNLQLTEGSYNWAVYKRTTTVLYDTIRTIDEDGIITIKLKPKTINSDVLLSGEQPMSFHVSEASVTGQTTWGYKDKTITVVLSMNNYLSMNPSAVVDPYLMGINDDWTTGMPLTAIGGNKYKLSIDGLDKGDMLMFNFRTGNVWENTSPRKRQLAITNDVTVDYEFGVFESPTSIDNFGVDNQPLTVYPNPARSTLFVRLSEATPVSYRVTGMAGQTMAHGNQFPVNLNGLPLGLYLLWVTDQKGQSYRARFIVAK